MGIPYSKEINKAFEELNKAYGQVTPLVAAAYEVLETTKNISLLLAGIQVLTVILLALILAALVGLLITMNPDLERERRELVTPVVHWVANGTRSMVWIATITAGIVLGITAVVWSTTQRDGRGSRQWLNEEKEGGGEQGGKEGEKDGE